MPPARRAPVSVSGAGGGVANGGARSLCEAHLATTCTGRRVPERPLPRRVSAQNCGQTPLKRASSTHLSQLEGEAVYSERLEQTEMNFQIAPFFSQAPSYRFLVVVVGGARHWASGNSFARQARGLLDLGDGGTARLPAQRMATDGAARCPRPPLPAHTPPGGHLAGRELSSNVTGRPPAWSRTARAGLLLVEWFPIKGMKGSWWPRRAWLRRVWDAGSRCDVCIGPSRRTTDARTAPEEEGRERGRHPSPPAQPASTDARGPWHGHSECSLVLQTHRSCSDAGGSVRPRRESGHCPRARKPDGQRQVGGHTRTDRRASRVGV